MARVLVEARGPSQSMQRFPPVKRAQLFGARHQSHLPDRRFFLYSCLFLAFVLSITLPLVFVSDGFASSSQAVGAAPATTSTSAATTQQQVASHATSSPTAAVQALSLSPLCNHNFHNGTCRSVVTYTSSKTFPETIVDASSNFVWPQMAVSGLPTTFQPGLNYGGASFLWNCGDHGLATWTVQLSGAAAASVIVSATQRSCPPLPI